MRKSILLASLLFLSLCCFCRLSNADNTDSAGRQKYKPDEIIVKFKDQATPERINQINTLLGSQELKSSRFAGLKTIKAPKGKTARQAVELYRQQPDVEYAELNYYVYAHLVPNDTYYWRQWNFKDVAGINIQPAWDITTGDPAVIVAALDSGVAYENYGEYKIAPDLANTNFTSGYDYVNNDSHPNDDGGHGTFITGTIAQSTGNSKGYAGIAFNCTIMPVKVLDETGHALHSDVADGINYAVDNGAKIINMSFGGESPSTTLRNAVMYAYNHGVTCICSAGNDGESAPPQYPAAYNNYCIAVGATRYDLTRASYSNTGSYIDLVAPGGDVLNPEPEVWKNAIGQQSYDPNTGEFSYNQLYVGTSVSAPHVTGTAGLLASLGITDPDDIRAALQNTAIDLGPAGRDDEYGYGLVDAFAAINYFFEQADIDKDGSVDLNDLKIVGENWLGDYPPADISPAGGDGIIDFADLAEFANAYLTQ